MSALTDAIEFACHAKGCAPPPVGVGGSRAGVGGAVGRGTRIRDLKARQDAIKAHRAGKTGATDAYRRARNRIADNKTRRYGNAEANVAAAKAKVKSTGKTRRTVSAKDLRSLKKGAETAQRAVNNKVGAHEANNVKRAAR